jgi:hypothetical protein
MAHNPAKLELTLSLLKADIAQFVNEFGADIPGVSVIADESYCDFDLRRFRGCHAQQICKLSSWRTEVVGLFPNESLHRPPRRRHTVGAKQRMGNPALSLHDAGSHRQLGR